MCYISELYIFWGFYLPKNYNKFVFLTFKLIKVFDILYNSKTYKPIELFLIPANGPRLV